MKRVFILILAIFTSVALNAQVTDLKGKVTDAQSGETLIGASVMISGTTTGVITDIDGNYEIKVPSEATLVFSCLGYKEIQVKFAGQTELNVTLEQDNRLLEESVVVGYSVQKKRDVLGAVSKVNGEELTKVPVSSVQQSLQGRIAGVEVSNQTGAPGSSISVRVRGTSSISSGNDPLYIVDGIPVEGALNSL